MSCKGEVIAFREESSDQYIHSEKLNVFIQQVLDEADITMGDLDAICVSKGPGSYTGLRIGVSAAKGLCFALEIPLLAVGTLQALAAGFYASSDGKGLCCPMIDARRMEVYATIFDQDLNELRPTEAVVIETSSFAEELAQGPVHFVGDGAEKCMDMITHEHAKFDVQVTASTRWMATLAQRRFNSEQFEDLAYFVPFYLKVYQAGKKKAG